MPFYDFACQSCGLEFEVLRKISDKSPVPCSKCGSVKTTKMVSACNFSIGKTLASAAAHDRVKQESEQRTELNRDYGLQTVRPLAGNPFSTVYSEVKKQGNFVKEQMIASKEKEAAKLKAKRKEWLPKAHKRAPAKYKIMQDQQAKEAAAKRRIVI